MLRRDNGNFNEWQTYLEEHPFHTIATVASVVATAGVGSRLLEHLVTEGISSPTTLALGAATVGAVLATRHFGGKLRELVEEAKQSGSTVDAETLKETPSLKTLGDAQAAIQADRSTAEDMVRGLTGKLEAKAPTLSM